MGEDVEVFASEKQIFNDIPEGMLSARNNEMNEKALQRYQEDSEKSDIELANPEKKERILGITVENPLIEVKVGETVTVNEELLELTYHGINPEAEEFESFEVLYENEELDSEFITISENSITGVKENAVFVILSWEDSQLTKKIRVNILSAEEEEEEEETPVEPAPEPEVPTTPVTPEEPVEIPSENQGE